MPSCQRKQASIERAPNTLDGVMDFPFTQKCRRAVERSADSVRRLSAPGPQLFSQQRPVARVRAEAPAPDLRYVFALMSPPPPTFSPRKNLARAAAAETRNP
jgi:hypothetical protein